MVTNKKKQKTKNKKTGKRALVPQLLKHHVFGKQLQ
jgi:hypothetical protein